ncbi:hypothetical protein AGDE_09834 [Angomonas deanei]|nr:hypothetical protein AGDE_09834 [Angomonas deanei]|eukprot:EPY29777.1 hypothetical protein AGDE_09834 [Angomonas deanei]
MTFTFTESNKEFNFLKDKDVSHLLSKWGVIEEGDSPAPQWYMKEFRFRCSDHSSENTNHRTLLRGKHQLHQFLSDFLKEKKEVPFRKALLELYPCLGEAASTCSEKEGCAHLEFTHIPNDVLDYQDMVDRLIQHKVVRDAREKLGEENESPAGASLSLPIARRSDTVLSGNAAVVRMSSRALFLLQKPGDESGDDDEEEDDFSGMGYGDFGGLSKKSLRSVLEGSVIKSSFLFHLLQRLVAGGGMMNQFEDDFAVYVDTSRALFREWITPTLTVRRVEDEAADEKGWFVPSSEALIYQLHTPYSMDRKKRAVAPYYELFNYCYLILNIKQQTCVFWYRGGVV